MTVTVANAWIKGASRRGRKGMLLMVRPRFAHALLRFRVAAAIEHLAVLRHVAAASLLDVGANRGQFSLAARALLPRAVIIAFEPLPEAADVYNNLFAKDALVSLHRVALSDRIGRAIFYVANRSDSSSLLHPGSGQADAFGIGTKKTICVEVKPLSNCVNLASLPRPIMLKIDVQGAELDVLAGCEALHLVDFVYVELSYVELYEKQPLFEEVAHFLSKHNFTLIGVFNQVLTPLFGPTQADFLFSRRK